MNGDKEEKKKKKKKKKIDEDLSPLFLSSCTNSRDWKPGLQVAGALVEADEREEEEEDTGELIRTRPEAFAVRKRRKGGGRFDPLKGKGGRKKNQKKNKNKNKKMDIEEEDRNIEQNIVENDDDNEEEEEEVEGNKEANTGEAQVLLGLWKI